MVKRSRNSSNQKNKRVKKNEDKQEIEDYCFECKDGGLLIICDHKDCVKAYHPECVGKGEGTEETDAPWICDWHSCLVCKKSPRYQCFCCKKALCQSCVKDYLFAKVRGSKGFCNECLNLALLGEEGVEVDSDGETVDFKDLETYEGLFKEYWDIIKEKEGLTLEDLHDADVQIKKDRNDKAIKSKMPQSDSEESVKEEENKESSSDDHDEDNDDDDDDVQPVIGTNNWRLEKTPRRIKGSSKIEYVGWASKSLIEFLAAIGVDTSEKLTQSDVTSMINKYAKENKLLHPEKRRIIVCDERLYSLLKRRTISKYKIHDGIEAHFLENLEQSEDEESSSGSEDSSAFVPTAKQQAWWKGVGSSNINKGSLLGKLTGKEDLQEEQPKKMDTVVNVVYSEFASIVPENMKLVYLKRVLVEKLSENDETFECKVMDSFVKVKSEPFDAKFPYKLLPVTGIKKASGDKNKTVLLQVSNLPNDVSMRMLSNDDVSLEDCEGLRRKIDTGLSPKLTVVELEKKAKDLHEDITKYAIARELHVLKHRIDLANEKGRRAEFYEYRIRRDLLQSKEEQFRMLNELPRVIADVIEVKPDSEDLVNDNDVETVNPTEISKDINKISS